MHSEHDLQERQRRTNHSESFPLWGATFLHNPWHQGPETRWMPYAPLRRRRRPLREYNFPPIFHKSPRFPCRRRRHKKWRRRRRTSPAQRYYITPEGGSPEPACKASADHRQNPWRPGPKARRRHQPSPAKAGVNLREYRKAPPKSRFRSRSRPRHRRLYPQAPIGACP